MIALLVGTMVAPGFMTGNTLYSICDLAPARECLAYIEGVSDTINAVQASGAARPIFCPGENVTAGQERDVVIKFLAENPAFRDRSANSLVGSALQGAFPCPK